MGEINWIVVSVIVAIIGLAIRFIPSLRRRVMSLWPWPISLTVSKEVSYQDNPCEVADRYWHTAFLEVEIKPWVHVNIRDFYVELNIGDRIEKRIYLLYR